MTSAQFVEMIGEAETGGMATKAVRLEAIGDRGLASGWYQQHWAWRRDYWTSESWAALRELDRLAIARFVERHPGKTARELADLYNLGHSDPDPRYDVRCKIGMVVAGIDTREYDRLVCD